MSSPKPGDKVRVTFEAEFVKIGYAIDPDKTGTTFKYEDLEFRVPNRVMLSAPEVLSPALPPEPPVGSVVLDAKGRAWQRRGSFKGASRWKATHHRMGEATWESLNLAVGPLRVLYNPESMREEDRDRD